MTKEELQRLTQVEDRSESNTKRLDGLDQTVNNIHDLTLAVKEIAVEMKAMREDMNKIDKRVMAIESKPSKRLDGIIDKIIFTILGIIIAYIFSKIGM